MSSDTGASISPLMEKVVVLTVRHLVMLRVGGQLPVHLPIANCRDHFVHIYSLIHNYTNYINTHTDMQKHTYISI